MSKAKALHTITTYLHEISLERELSEEEAVCFLVAQLALTPTVTESTLLQTIGR